MELPILAQVKLISPIVVTALGALIVLLCGVFSTSACKKSATSGCSPSGGCLCNLSLLILVLATIGGVFFSPEALFGVAHNQIELFGGLLTVDSLSRFLTVLILVGSVFSLMIGRSSIAREGIETPGEYYSLILMAICGALVLVSSADLVTFFVALETMSMALYCLCGAALGSRRSSESALKYFLLGSFSAAFLVYGIAMIYGATGSMHINVIAERVVDSDSALALMGIGLILLGLVFKIGLVPFHFWVPDVYQGAPTPLTAFMACVIKCAAVGAALRILWGGFGELLPFWSTAVWYIAFFTMTVANLVALRQRSVKRMLAYSSVAHAGYMSMAFLAPAKELGGGAAILYYLLAYTAMTIGAFGVLLALPKAESERGGDSYDIGRLAGLSKVSPFLAAMMALFMLSLAGIPPGVAGLFGKIYLIGSTIRAEYIGLAVVAVVNSVLAAYYYLRVVVAMYFMLPEGDISAKECCSSGAKTCCDTPLAVVIIVCGVFVVLAGIFPSYFISQAEHAFSNFGYSEGTVLIASARR